MCLPLVTDYVQKSSRGKATAFQTLGYGLGELLTFGVLFTITKNMDPFDSFLTASLTISCFAFSFIFLVKEPDMKKIHMAST
mmetsp:Transcript_6594/g.5887  ORF Transcript_6594/g.5887 Transcript_6594/m.5887 type:complete len:82 (+) Transcript_6594:122-367(+)